MTTEVLVYRWSPLSEAALCLDDEIVFSIRERECPLCGSQNFVLLATWLSEHRKTEP